MTKTLLPRAKQASSLLTIAIVAGSFSGCTGNARDTADTIVSASAPTQSASTSASVAPTEGSAQISWETVADFVSASHEADYETAFRLAAPDSPAYRYVLHQQAAHEAQVTSGNAPENLDYTIEANQDAGTVSIDYTDNDGDPAGYTWSDFKVDDRGRVYSWTGKSGPVADVLWSKDSHVTVAGTNVSLVSAYRANSGDLYVVLDVSPSKFALSPDYEPTFVGADKRTREATAAIVPDRIDKGTSGYLMYVFQGAKFGGTVTVNIQDGGYNDRGSAKIRIS